MVSNLDAHRQKKLVILRFRINQMDADESRASEKKQIKRI